MQYVVQLQNSGNVPLRNMEATLGTLQFICEGADMTSVAGGDLVLCTANYTTNWEEAEQGSVTNSMSVRAITGPAADPQAFLQTDIPLPDVTISPVRAMVLHVFPGSCPQPVYARKWLTLAAA